ncbi:hypothetical protein DMA11_13185 [Marinilabiliaceae bacterium JC017]|nr:hypothetical protein DMA11_13185 [Marinilabiliaceae bacterium JC017]
MRKVIWITTVLSVLLVGCMGDEFEIDRISDEIELSPGVSLPLAYAGLTIKDILSDETDNVRYYKDAEGNERIMLYQVDDSVEYVGINDFFRISTPEINVPVPFTSFNISSEITAQQDISFNIPAASISKLDLSYRIVFDASDFVVPVSLELFMPSVNAPEGKKIMTELSGNEVKEFVFKNDQVTLSDNKLNVNLTIRPVNTGGSFPAETGSLRLKIDQFQVSYVKGSMGENAVEIDKGNYEFDLDIFEKFNHGLTFDNPKLHTMFTNSTPFRGLIMPQFKGVSEDGEELRIEAPFMEMSACPTGEAFIRDTSTYDKTNSNVTAFFDLPPKYLEYTGNLVLNPNGEVNDEIELWEDDRIYVGYMIEAPIELVLDSEMDVDTVDISSSDVLDDLEKATLVIESENGFPFNAHATIGFWDEASESIIETIETTVIEPAAVNSEGITSERIVATEKIELTPQQIENLRQTDKLFITLRLSSTNFEKEQVVTLLADNKLDLKISMKAQLELNQ